MMTAVAGSTVPFFQGEPGKRIRGQEENPVDKSGDLKLKGEAATSESTRISREDSLLPKS